MTVALVGGLVATAAIPAFGLARPTEESVTLQQVAADNAQSLVVASDASATELTRESYSATTQQEIDDKKAKEAAAAAAAARARMSAKVASTSIGQNIQLVSPGTGEVRWPLLSFTRGRGLGDSGYHQGVDLLTSCGQPIYAAAGGVVKVSQESFGGYGVAVTIDHVIGGQRVSTLYGHMTYGSRQVSAGQSVAARPAHRPRRQHRQFDRVPPALRGAHQRLGRRPVGLAAGQRRLTFVDTPPRVHRRLRPSCARRALA